MLHEHGYAVIPGKVRNFLGLGNIIAARIMCLACMSRLTPKVKIARPASASSPINLALIVTVFFPRRKVSVETLMRPDAGPTKLI